MPFWMLNLSSSLVTVFSDSKHLIIGSFALSNVVTWPRRNKHNIARYTAARPMNQTAVASLDTITWIDAVITNVTELTTRNAFWTTGLIRPSSTLYFLMTSTDVSMKNHQEFNNPNHSLKQLNFLLAHVRIDGHQFQFQSVSIPVIEPKLELVGTDQNRNWNRPEPCGTGNGWYHSKKNL